MTTGISSGDRLAIDAKSLADLKKVSGLDPKAATGEVAKQFEVLLLNMLMKSMRDAMPKDDPLNSSANEMYTGMLDQQFAQKIAQRGTGLASMIEKQLSGRGADGKTVATTASTAGANSTGAVPARTATASAAGAEGGSAAHAISIRFADAGSLKKILGGMRPAAAQAADLQNVKLPADEPAAVAPTEQGRFLKTMLAHARVAESSSGIPAKFMLGQAALESGWGQREIVGADGTRSHNLFGIKAGSGWKGPTVQVATTEYTNGTPRKVVQSFRVYASYAESFQDYANLISKNARYGGATAANLTPADFARAVQQGGYATDPQYAQKLTRSIHRVSALTHPELIGGPV